MRSSLVAVALLFLLVGASGCLAWQANKSSQAVGIDPFAMGSGESVFKPSNAPGYVNGDAQDMRTRR
jgi:hypothetical protein